MFTWVRCFHSLSTQNFRRALGRFHSDGQLRGDKECPSSGVTKSGRVRRKAPESDARSVVYLAEFGGRRRKAMLGV